jgi:hypothetical protein
VKLIVAFRKFAKKPKGEIFSVQNAPMPNPNRIEAHVECFLLGCSPAAVVYMLFNSINFI